MGIDRVGRLAPGTKTNDRTVRDTYADRAGRRLGPIHPFCEVGALGLACQRRRQEHGAWAEIYRLGLEMQVNIRWQTTLQYPIPDAFRPMGVMVSWQHMPLDIAKPAHSLQRLKQGPRRRRLGVVNITGHQNVGCPFLRREPPDILDRDQAGLPQHAFPVAELLEWLPICQSAV